MKIKDIALDGVVRQNPVFKLVLGTCPTRWAWGWR